MSVSIVPDLDSELGASLWRQVVFLAKGKRLFRSDEFQALFVEITTILAFCLGSLPCSPHCC